MSDAGNPVGEAAAPPVLRVFTALHVTPAEAPDVKALLDRLQPAAAIRWSLIENLHVTTKFIGNWPSDRIEELKLVLAAVAAHNSGAFQVDIRGLGWFPNPHQPHSFWAGAHGGDALQELHSATDGVTTALGVPKERKDYFPHVTLARIPSGGKTDLGPLRRAVAGLESVDFGGFRARHFYLFSSRPGATRSIYEKLAEFPL